MQSDQKKIPIHELILGMYVARLDRPWVGTPFPIQGFHIRTQDDINTLSHHCKHVYVDVERCNIPKSLENKDTSSAGSSTTRITSICHDAYGETKPLKKEINKASHLHHEVTKAVDHIADKLLLGKKLKISNVRRVANKMIDSVIRNPDALIWVSRIKDKDSHIYSHSIRASVWAIVFGRYIGLPKTQLENLAMGVLLSEVGKIKLPTELLTKKSRLTNDEFAQFKKHIDYGVDILSNTEGVNDEIISIVQCHHEKFNGKGYPRGLRGEQIPFLARLAGIVDCYDEITNPRPHKKPMTPSEAIVKLHELRNEEFHGDLIDEFIQAVGIYPTGTIVQLSTGEVGVITEQNYQRRLRPMVMLVLDNNKKLLKKRRMINLFEQEKDKNGTPIGIKKSLPEGAFGIDQEKLQNNVFERLWKSNGLFAGI